MNREQIAHVHGLITRDDHESYKSAVEYIREVTAPENKTPITSENALLCLKIVLQGLLDNSRYEDAAVFLWGERTFDGRPQSVRRIWKAMDEHDKLLCLGAGVQGKTYTPTVKVFLRWIEDPQYTSVKLVSTSGGHARSNIFAGFVKLHREACIPVSGLIRESFIGLETGAQQSSIEKVSIAKGDNGTAALRGFHRMPRKKIHPKFGEMSVVILLMDEADDIPWGAWVGADNLASGSGDKGGIKIYAATNPRKRESEFAKRAEPQKGWTSINKETSHEWQGKYGWYVIRLDARQSENYKERREVYGGLMTYDAAKDYEARGTSDPDVWTFVYGLYPMESAKYYVVPAVILDNIRGTYNFIRTPWNVASFDPAFAEGGDRPVLTVGRYGLANGFRTPDGKFHKLPDASRWSLQVEQQIEIEKRSNPVDMADDLIEKLRKLHVSPEWFSLDCTGNATMLQGYLLKKYGGVLGLKWGEAATEHKVFEEDPEKADEQFVGLISEMWFSFSRWAQFGYIKLAPMMQTDELFNELGSRKYEHASKTMMLVESKDDFKKNNSGKSPDYSDSLIMLVQLCRARGQDRPALFQADQRPQLPPDVWRGEDDWSSFDRSRMESEKNLHSVVDKLPFLDFNE